MVLWSTRALGVSLVELRQEEKQNNIFVNKQVSAVVGQLFRRRLKVHLEVERWLQHALGWRQSSHGSIKLMLLGAISLRKQSE